MPGMVFWTVLCPIRGLMRHSRAVAVRTNWVIAHPAESPPELPLAAVPAAKVLRRVEKVPFAGRNLYDHRKIIFGQLLSSDVNSAKTFILQELQKLGIFLCSHTSTDTCDRCGCNPRARYRAPGRFIHSSHTSPNPRLFPRPISAVFSTIPRCTRVG